VDDFVGFPGLHLLTRVDAGPGGAPPVTGATVSSDNNHFPFAVPANNDVALAQISPGSSSWAKLFPITSADFPDIEGRYTYTVTDSSAASTTLESHRLDHPAIIPHPTNLAVNNHTTAPLFTFTDPNPTPSSGQLTRVYDMVIFDSSGLQVAILPSPTTSSATPSIQVDSGLLTIGQQYWFRAQSIDIDVEGGISYVENIGESLLSFTPVPESSHVIALGGVLIGMAGFRTRRKGR
jgi:hypothetical protein